MTRDELLRDIEMLAFGSGTSPVETLGRIRDLFRQYDEERMIEP